MSDKFIKSGDFLMLLLNAEKVQAKALLDTVSLNQASLIGEVVHNILTTVPIPTSERRKLNRKLYLKRIADLHRSYKSRKLEIKKHKKDLLDLFASYSHPLTQITRHLQHSERLD